MAYVYLNSYMEYPKRGSLCEGTRKEGKISFGTKPKPNICTRCFGMGRVMHPDYKAQHEGWSIMTCPRCHGTREEPEEVPLWRKLEDAFNKGYPVKVKWEDEKGGKAWHTGRIIERDVVYDDFEGPCTSFRMDGSGWTLMENVISIERVDNDEMAEDKPPEDEPKDGSSKITEARTIIREAFAEDRGFKMTYIASIEMLLYDELKGEGHSERVQNDIAEKILDLIFSKGAEPKDAPPKGESEEQSIMAKLARAKEYHRPVSIDLSTHGPMVGFIEHLASDVVYLEMLPYPIQDIESVTIYGDPGKATTNEPQPPDMTLQAEILKEHMNMYGVSGITGIIRGATCCSTHDAIHTPIHHNLGIVTIKYELEQHWLNAHKQENTED